MKNSILSTITMVIAVLALIVSIFAFSKVIRLQKQLPISNQTTATEETEGDEFEGHEDIRSFDKSLVGDWAGSIAGTTQYVRMKVLEDSSIIIESQGGGITYFYVGYIENEMTVIEQRARLGKVSEYLAEHEPGDSISLYINNKGSFELEDYAVARGLSRPTTDSILVNYGMVLGSGGEEIVTLTRR